MKIRSVSHPSGKMQLGETCEFLIEGYDGSIQCHLWFDYLLSSEPLEISGSTVRIFPEAPGIYALAVRALAPGGEVTWAETAFEVILEGCTGGGPRLVEVSPNVRMWTSSPWESASAVTHEKELMLRLPEVVKPGSVVYDVGANIGLYAIVFSQLTGSKGHVYCFEPNPLCGYFLTQNLKENRISNCSVLPFAASDKVGSLDFKLNYGNLAVGIGKTSDYFCLKPGHVIGVRAAPIDDLMSDYNLRRPDVIKIDVEGAEGAVVAGLLKTIALLRPTLILELHGIGAAQVVLRQLAQFPYRYTELSKGTNFATAKELNDWWPDAVIQVIAQPTT